MAKIEDAMDMLTKSAYASKTIESAGIKVSQDGSKRTGFELLAFPDVTFETPH